MLQFCSVYTSVTSAKRQKDSDTNKNSAPLNAALVRTHGSAAARSLSSKAKSRATDRAPARAEKALTRRAMLPIGKKVMSFAPGNRLVSQQDGLYPMCKR